MNAQRILAAMATVSTNRVATPASVEPATSLTVKLAETSTSAPMKTLASTALAPTLSAPSCARADPVITSTTTTTRATVNTRTVAQSTLTFFLFT